MKLKKREQVILTLSCVLMGFLFVVLLEAQRDAGSQRVGQEVSVPNLIQIEQENQQISVDNERLQEELAKYAQSQSASALADQQLQAAIMGAGGIAVMGQGLRITLNDSKTIADWSDTNNYIHDIYIRTILNALWNGGAEAISVNDQRVTTNTEVFCAGSYIQINGTRQIPPYIINAIGEPNNLSSALDFYVWYKLADLQKEYGITRNLEVLQEVMIPAAKLPNYRYAEPVKEEL